MQISTKKKFVISTVVLAVLVFALTYAVYASYEIKILINGIPLETTAEPIIKDGTTLVPMRDVFEGLGADVTWDDDKRIATGKYNGTTVTVHPDSGKIYRDSQEVELNHPPVILSDRILVPLRAISESLGYNVLWDGRNYTVSISSNRYMKVHFLDAGQADSIFIELPDGKCMLVDAGEVDFGKTLAEFITSRGYSHIDYVVASHPHSDHIGGMAHILKNFTVGKFYMPEISHNTKTFERMFDALSENGCPREYISQGDVITESPYAVKVLAPQKRWYKSMNDYSAVLKITYQNKSVILSADAESVSEGEIVNINESLKSDVIKIGHHGSYTSTSPEYIDAIAPQDAIISLGKNNSYNFPSDVILWRLENMGINIHRTDISGNIRMISDGYIYIIESDK